MQRESSVLLGLALVVAGIVVVLLAVLAASGPDPAATPAATPTPTIASPSTLPPIATLAQGDALRTATSGIQSALDRIDAATAQAAAALGPTGMAGDEARRILARLADVSPAAIDATAVSKDGIMLTVEPREYASAEGADIADQEQMQRLRATQKPVMSRVFSTVEGVNATDLEHPVFAAGQFNGSASLLFNPTVLLTIAIEDALGGRSAEVFVMDTDGLMLYDRDATEIGRYAFSDPLYANNAELLAIADRMRTEDEGTGSYTFAAEGSTTEVRKTVAWDSVGLHGTEWRVAAVATAAPA